MLSRCFVSRKVFQARNAQVFLRSISTKTMSFEKETYAGNIWDDSTDVLDPVLGNLTKKEKNRQKQGLVLIASENFTSRAVCEMLGSCLSNKYSEGYPGARYYAGNEFIDQIEILCQERALEVFGLSPEQWGVNVQPLSGTPANFAIYTALIGPHGRVMGLGLSDGGHLSHGFYSPAKKVSATSLFFEAFPYRVNTETGLIDYDQLEQNAKLFRPDIIVAGISCYPRNLDYARFRKIADSVGAYLLADMSHVSGLVAGGVAPSPFGYADVVMTTTHKSLRGPRGAMIFYRKGVRSVTAKGEEVKYDIENPINWAVFPGLQGGPHNNVIAGIAVTLKQCMTTQFVDYAKQIVANSKALANRLTELGYTLVTGGTDTHLILVDLRNNKLEGSRIETVLDLALIACNKNTCPGDQTPFKPSGIRLGTPALTTRGFKEADFVKVADFIHEAIEIFKKHEHKCGKLIKDFKHFIATDEEFLADIKKVAEKVEAFTANFPIPGTDVY
ncbi:unnamed protein product [Bursaphelenchus okinawaensis]|uniref:Serine hydroxymethyltransferase n=1 Tax=Bursaphelenchus okinawaensis TaxID=465554 RepID=A0A811K5Z2_9BILA|nr:unnamed protein product [Bursaphelenchus okinawaensis]CAG9092874.1 unnamed protein product [Bursaphelenchus okinawaensis]